MSKKIASFILTLITISILTARCVFAATTFSATFNFDVGSPALYLRQPTPFVQTSNNITANFSSPSDFPSQPVFSVQTVDSLAASSIGINSTRFSGLFLWPSNVNRNNLTISFSSNVTSISMDFKTAETHDPGPGGTGSPISLTAYMDSFSTMVGSPVTVNGNETLFDTYPEGTLAFNSSGQPFNLVSISLPFIPQGASGFIIDNVTVAGTDVIPEFPSAYTLSVSMLLVAATLVIVKRKVIKHSGQTQLFFS